MITWFDALLVTVWALVTALGARRGLAGLVWGLGGVAACLLTNLLARGAVAATVLALLLGVGLAVGTRQLVREPTSGLWAAGAGALGGFALGGLLVATLTLGFPIEVRVGGQGRTGVYPSTGLPPVLYKAVNGSVLKDGLRWVWPAGPVLHTLLVPDQVR